MRTYRATAVAIAMAALAGAAVAQEHPPMAPTKDVTIEYKYVMQGNPAQARTSRTMIAAGGKQMRIEGLGPQGYMILDRADARMIMVMDQQHMYMERPLDPARAGPLVLQDNMKFSRTGNDTVAGISCTVWQVQGQHGSGSACISDDGVLLRAESAEQGGHMTMTATSVTFGPLAASLFQPPPGYQKMDMPAMPQGMGRPGMPPPKP